MFGADELPELIHRGGDECKAEPRGRGRQAVVAVLTGPTLVEQLPPYAERGSYLKTGRSSPG